MAILLLEALRKPDRFVLPSIVFGVSFIVYLVTLCPTVHVGDSGEFITNAYILGINHPTGYPLHALLGRTVILLLPLVTPAFAVNLLSALAASLTTVCAYFILKILLARVDVAAATALLFGFSNTLWSRATTAEVYPLVLLSEAIAIVCLLRWRSTNNFRELIVVAYVTGLGLSQHALGLLVAICSCCFVLFERPRLFLNLRLLLILLGFAFLGWTTYLYLPIRAAAHPPIAWGDPETLRNFIHHLYPVGGKGISSLFGGEQGGRFTWVLETAFTKEFGYFGILAIPGVYMLRRHRSLLFLFVSIPALITVFTVNRTLPLHADFDAYLLPAYLAMAVLIGCGISFLLETIKRSSAVRKHREYHMAASGFTLLLPLVLVLVNFAGNDKSHDYFARDFSTNLLRPLKPHAILFTIGDEQTFLGWVSKYVEGTRKDITVVSTLLLGARWGGTHMFQGEFGMLPEVPEPAEATARRIIQGNIGHRPIYFTHKLPWDFLQKEYDSVPVGMLVQILPRGSDILYQPSSFAFHPPSLSASLDARCRLLINFYPQQLAANAQFWINREQSSAARSELDQFFALPFEPRNEELATALVLRGIIFSRERRFAEAVSCADSALNVAPRDWRAYQYRGEFCLGNGDSLGALRDWSKSLELNPQNPPLRGRASLLRLLTGRRR